MASVAEHFLMKSKFNRVSVFCGSSSGNNLIYQYTAVQLGKHLAERSIDLVYGEGSIGLIGSVSQAICESGRHVLGIIPKALAPKEIIEETVGEVKIVPDIHQRKAEMFNQTYAFIALLGGYGTREELMKVITWAQLEIHDKLVSLLNVGGYYDSLLSFIDNAVDEGFITPVTKHILISTPTTEELMCKLENADTVWEINHQHQLDPCKEITATMVASIVGGNEKVSD